MLFPYQIIDLSHVLSSKVPTWDGGCGFSCQIALDYEDSLKGGLDSVPFRIQQAQFPLGIGTHLDAPAHCVPGGMSVDELSWQSLICPAVVIDVADRAHSHYLVSPQDIEQFEAAFGIIPPGALVLIRTGWERFWTNPDKYRNNWFFPSLAEEAALLLLERQIHGLGIDTLSPDRPDIGFKVHRALLSQGKYLIENVANSAQLPPIGSFILSLPLAIEGATESPIRLLAFLPKGSP